MMERDYSPKLQPMPTATTTVGIRVNEIHFLILSEVIGCVRYLPMTDRFFYVSIDKRQSNVNKKIVVPIEPNISELHPDCFYQKY